jgi:hypothetical protein
MLNMDFGIDTSHNRNVYFGALPRTSSECTPRTTLALKEEEEAQAVAVAAAQSEPGAAAVINNK